MGWAFDATVMTSDGCFRDYRRSNSARRRRWEDLVREWPACADIGVRVVSLVGGLYTSSDDRRVYLREEALDAAYACYLLARSAGAYSRMAFSDWATGLMGFLAIRLKGLTVAVGDEHWTVASEIGVLGWWSSLGHPAGVTVTSGTSVMSSATARERVQAMLLDRWTSDLIAEVERSGW